MMGLDLDNVLSLTIADTRRHLARLFPIFLLIAIGMNLVNGMVLEQMETSETPSLIFGVLFVLIAFAFFALSIQALLVDRALRDAPMDFGTVAKIAVQRLPALLVMLLAYYLVVILGFILLIIPGIILAVTLGYCWFFVILDNRGPIDALRESFRVIWGNAWQVVGANVLLAVVYVTAFGVTVLLLPGSFVELMTLLTEGYAYADWRRWVFDLLGVPFSVVYLFLNLHLFRELKLIKASRDVDSADAATVSA